MTDLSLWLSQTPEKRSVRLAGHATSLTIEPAFWHAFTALAQRDGVTITTRLLEVDTMRQCSLSAAVRLYVLYRLSGQTTPESLQLGIHEIPPEDKAK